MRRSPRLQYDARERQSPTRSSRFHLDIRPKRLVLATLCLDAG